MFAILFYNNNIKYVIINYPPSIVLLVPSIDGPPNQFVPIPVPGVQSKAPLPFCHSQSGIDGTGPKSQKTSSTVTVGGGMVTVGYLTNIKLQVRDFYIIFYDYYYCN